MGLPNYLLPGLLLLSLSCTSLFVGVIDLRPIDLLQSSQAWELLFDSRGPRLLAILIAGSSLAICGSIMQMLTRNRFVEPTTVGTGQGAALGVLLATLLIPAAPLWLRMCLASFCAFATSIGFLALIRRLPPTEPILVPLVGLTYGGVIGAAVTFVAYQGDLLQYIEIWTNGEFSGVLRGRYELLWLAAIAASLTYLAADQFSILGLGETTTISLGLSVRQVMLFGIATVSMVTALVVVVVGAIPFVGLVVPNIVSRLYGDNLRNTLPVTALLGASLVLASDMIGRLARSPYEIPVGTIMGVIGAVVFLWLLHKPTHYGA
ncbi:MAG: iron chelate uptake ABC transporter family permease subunit [Pseudomonadota bacterium]